MTLKNIYLPFLAGALLSACTTTTVKVDVELNEKPEPAEQEETSEKNYTSIVPMPSKRLDESKTLTRISFGSCLRQDLDQSIWNKVREANSDLFLYMGDNVYGDNYSNDPALPELITAYNVLAQSEPFNALRQSTPVLATWDDHDYGMNDFGKDFYKKELAEEMFEDVWAIPEDSPVRARPGIYDAKIIGSEEGKRVQIIMLDTRYFRDDLNPTDEKGARGKERYIPDLDPSKTMLGEAQWQWLEEELKKPADLRIIASSIQLIADGHGWEAWRTLPAQRQKMYDVINSTKAKNVIFVSGDRHAAAFYRKKNVLDYPLYEFTSSSLNSPVSVWRRQSNTTFMELGPNRLTDMYFEANFGVIDLNWEEEQVIFKLMDENGEVAMKKSFYLTEIE